MCTASAASFSNTGMFLGGTIGQIYGGLTAANAAQDYHNANADYLTTMAQVNTQMAENSISATQYAGGMQASAAREKGLQTVKAQRAAMGSRGLSNSATYQSLTDDSIARSEMDAQAILYNADLQSLNTKTSAKIQQIQYLAQAEQERAAGRIAKASGILSTLNTVGNSLSKWTQTSMGKTAGTASASTGSSDGYSFSLPGWQYNPASSITPGGSLLSVTNKNLGAGINNVYNFPTYKFSWRR